MQDLDLNGSSYQKEAIRELGGQYLKMDGLETVFEQEWTVFGAYRPHRFLPALYVSLQDQEGYVIPHGTVVSSENIKAPVAGNFNAYNTEAGLTVGGQFFHGLDNQGTPMQQNVRELYGYDTTLDGVIVPTNGSLAAVNDPYTMYDLIISRNRLDGQLVSQADVTGGATAITRNPGIPIGVMHHQVMRETQGVNMQYRLYTAAISACTYGVLNIPYIMADATTIANPVITDVGYNAVYWRHQFLFVQDMTKLQPSFRPSVDAYGKLILPTTPANFPQQFGKIISWTNETFPDLMSRVQGYPGLDVPGTNTGGMTRRLFDLIKRIRTAHGLPVKISDIVADLNSGKYGMIKVLFNTMV